MYLHHVKDKNLGDSILGSSNKHAKGLACLFESLPDFRGIEKHRQDDHKENKPTT